MKNFRAKIEPLAKYAIGYRDHPIKILYENGVKVTINTDDLLIFDSSIENEYLLLYRAGTLSAGQLDEIRKNGLFTVLKNFRAKIEPLAKYPFSPYPTILHGASTMYK